MDADAAAKQANALKDSVRKLERSKLISSVRASDLRRQRDLLVERLADFDTTNKTLRKMLRQTQRDEVCVCVCVCVCVIFFVFLDIFLSVHESVCLFVCH